MYFGTITQLIQIALEQHYHINGDHFGQQVTKDHLLTIDHGSERSRKKTGFSKR